MKMKFKLSTIWYGNFEQYKKLVLEELDRLEIESKKAKELSLSYTPKGKLYEVIKESQSLGFSLIDNRYRMFLEYNKEIKRYEAKNTFGEHIVVTYPHNTYGYTTSQIELLLTMGIIKLYEKLKSSSNS